MPKTFQTKGFVCKTISQDVLDACLSFCRGVSGARWAYAQHVPAPPKVPHWHFVGLFVDRVFWKSVYDFANRLDPCSSTDTCKKPRKALRYLLHLDSPDKHLVERSALVTGGDWGPDEIDDWLEQSSAASSIVHTCLDFYSSGLSPLEAFERLVTYGFEPFQISASLQAFSRLSEFWLKQAPNAHKRGMGAVSRPHLEPTFSTPQPQRGGIEDSDYQGKKTSVIPSDTEFNPPTTAETRNGTVGKSSQARSTNDGNGDFPRCSEESAPSGSDSEFFAVLPGCTILRGSSASARRVLTH